MSNDFDDFIIVSSSNKKVAASVKKALLKKIEEEEQEYNPQDCAHCTMVGAHICEPCEGKWHS